MSSLQSRRDFLVKTGTAIAIPPYLNKTNLIQDFLSDPVEAIGERYEDFLAIAREERKIITLKLSDDIRSKIKLLDYKTLGNLIFDPNATAKDVKREFRALYKSLLNLIKTNPANLEKILDELKGSSLDEYHDRLSLLAEMSCGLIKLIPTKILSDKEMSSLNSLHANFMNSLATRNDLDAHQCYKILEDFFKTTRNNIEANYRLRSRRELAYRLARQAA